MPGNSFAQLKLEIGKQDDPQEKEADAVADKVMMMPSSFTSTPPPQRDPHALQMSPAEMQELRMTGDEEEKITMSPLEHTVMMVAAGGDDDEPPVRMKALTTAFRKAEEEEHAPQLKPAADGKSYASPDVSAGLAASSGGGSALPAPVNAEMSSKIGADFSNVRIHTDNKAVAMSHSLGAQAFTYGRDIYFNQGKYNPSSPSGKHLLAHELTHTVQQGAAVQTKPLVSETQPKVQRLLGAVRETINDYARYIPGWTLFTVIIGFNPLLGTPVERTAENLIGGLLELIPVFGVLMMNKLREHNIITNAYNWVMERLATLDLSVARLERTIESAYEEMDFIRLDPVDYNVAVLQRHFVPLMDDVMTFVGDVGRQILQMIKDALISALKAIAEAFPGYPLLTKILGVDPLTGQQVISTTAEKIEDFLVLIGKEQELQKMREEGTIQRTADWLDIELAQLNFSFEEISALFTTAWESFSMADLQDPIGAFNRTVAIFQPFVSRVFTFAYNVATKVLEFIKDALLRALSDFARQQRGYHLLTVLLGRDPFTNEVVERNVENIIRGFMSLMEGGEEQFQQMRETGAIQQTTDRINAAVAELGFNLDYIVGLFIGLWNSFTIEDIFNPIAAFQRIIDTLGEPLGRLFTFIVTIVRIVVEVLLEVMDFPTDTINSIISNAMQAFEDIKRDPIGFLKNLLAAVKQGFSQFFDNILTHLLNGLRDWLFGELATAGIRPPADLSFSSILGFVLDTLGISVENIWDRLGRKIGAERVAQIRSAIDTLSGIWTFIKDVYERGPVAIWEYVQEQLGNLWDTVIGMIRDWIMTRIISQVTTRLLSMLDPTGIMAVVNGFIAFYRAVQSFIEKLRQMLEIVNSFVAGVANIARGDISQAANYLEGALARAIPVAIGFLANQVGLRGLGARIAEMIGGLREQVNRAIDWLIDRALSIGGALLNLGRRAVAAVTGWLGFDTPFTTANNETHTIKIEEESGQNVVNIYSVKKRLSEYLTEKQAQIEAMPAGTEKTTQADHLRSARSIYSEVNALTVEIFRLKQIRRPSPQETQLLQTKENALQAKLGELRGHLSAMGITGADVAGEIANPFQPVIALGYPEGATIYRTYRSTSSTPFIAQISFNPTFQAGGQTLPVVVVTYSQNFRGRSGNMTDHLPVATFVREVDGGQISLHAPDGDTRERREYLRAMTPSGQLQSWAQSQLPSGSVDPAFPTLTVQGSAQADHIVPVARIFQMSGFWDLAQGQQLEVLNWSNNFVALSPAANASKGAKSFRQWTRHASLGLNVDPGFRSQMMSRESSLESALPTEIARRRTT